MRPWPGGCSAQGFGAGDQSKEVTGFGERLGLESEARAGLLSGQGSRQAIPAGRAPQPGAGPGACGKFAVLGSPARTPVTCWRCSKVGSVGLESEWGPQPGGGGPRGMS